MCIVNATKAYKPPAARTATAFVSSASVVSTVFCAYSSFRCVSIDLRGQPCDDAVQ